MYHRLCRWSACGRALSGAVLIASVAAAAFATSASAEEEPLPRGAVSRWGGGVFRQGSQIQALAISPDGTRVATSGYEAGAPILIRQIPSRLPLQRLAEDYWGSGSLAWSPDGKYLAAGSARDATIRLWDVDSGRRVHLLRTSVYPRPTLVGSSVHVAFTVDGKSLLSVDPAGVFQFWDHLTGEETGRISLEHKPDPSFATVRSLAVSRDGKLAVATMIGGKLWLVDLAQRKAEWWIDGGEGWLVQAKFSPDSQTLYWTTNIAEEDLKPDIGVRAWDVATKKLRTQFLPSGRRAQVGFGNGFDVTRDGNSLVFADYLSHLICYDTTTGKQRWEVSPGERIVGPQLAAITPDDQWAVTDWRSGSLRFWQLADGKEVQPLASHEAFDVDRLAVSADGALLYAVRRQGVAQIWDTASGKKIQETESAQHTGHSNPHLQAIVPEAKRLVLGEFPGSQVYLIDLENWRQESLDGFTNPAAAKEYERGTVGPAVLSRDGKLLAAVARKVAYAQAGLIRVWDVSQKKLLYEWPVGDQEFATLAMSADGRELAIGRQTHVRGMMQPLAFEIVDLANGKVQRRLSVKGASVVAQQPQLSPDGRWLALAGFRDQVHLWDFARGEYRGYLSGRRPSLALSEVAFSPSGNRLAALGAPGAMNRSYSVVEVWDLASGRHTHRFEQPVRNVCFSPDGNRLYLATTSYSILTYDLTLGVSDLPAEPATLTAAEAAELWFGLGGTGASHLGPMADSVRTDLADKLAAAGDGVLPLLRPMFDVSLDGETTPLLDAVAALKSENAALRREAAQMLGGLGDKCWTLVRDAAKQPPTDAQLLELKNLLREVPRQRRFHALDAVVRSMETPAAGEFLRELAQSGRERGGAEGNTLARMADGMAQKWKPFRAE